MIVYRELSSLCNALGYSAKALYTASNSIYRHYHKVELPKKNGGKRILHVPDIFLKSIQKSIVKNILAYEEISIYATAYHVGGSTKKNAEPHVGADTILKMDIKHSIHHFGRVFNHTTLQSYPQTHPPYLKNYDLHLELY